MLNESSLLSEKKQLKIRTKNVPKFTHMTTNCTRRGLGKRGSSTNKRNNIIFICTTTLSPRNVKSKYQFFFKNVIFFLFINFSFGQTSSFITYRLVSMGLLIGRVSVAILPLIMHMTTAICFFPSRNGLKFSSIPV